jgi:hypothetical protein
MLAQRKRRREKLCNARTLQRCVVRLLTQSLFKDVVFSAVCSWTPLTLCATILFWVWSDEPTLIERFRTARRITMEGFQLSRELSSAYQPFMRRLVRWSPVLLLQVIGRFRYLMSRQLSGNFRWHGYAVFAVDGTRFEVPRTESNLQAFAAKENNGKRKRHRKYNRKPADIKKSITAQIWMTVVWHLGTGLPWDWRRGQTGSSERDHLREMISGLPSNSLIAGDAGLVGYALWRLIRKAHHHLLIRVGANVELLTALGYHETRGQRVYLWPEKAQQHHSEPLVLRLVVVKRRRQPIYLVTSVLDHRLLSDQQAADIYRRRWGVEVFYRAMKETFERRKLRSNSCTHALCELDWSLVGLWAVCLHSQLQHRRAKNRRISVAKLLRAIRKSMREYQTVPRAGEDLWTLVALAVNGNNARRNKASRNYPIKKRRRTIGAPLIHPATAKQREEAQSIKELSTNNASNQG